MPANADLQDVSAPGVAVSAKVIGTLRELPADEAGVFAGRLASEVAIARTIEGGLRNPSAADQRQAGCPR